MWFAEMDRYAKVEDRVDMEQNMMKEMSKAELISYNVNHMEVCASAARISTTKGNSIEIFEKAKNNEKNRELIKKVLMSGHKSIIEHAVVTLAFWNVSAYVEQFFIECRLASFTVKSRRYVDFSKQGYYVPPELEGGDKKEYCQYMDMLFLTYQDLLKLDIPKEDARFLLPYSFNSNFYCTLNVRELLNIIYAIRYGRGRGVSELQNLADQIEKQVKEIFPYLSYELENRKEGNCREEKISDIIHCKDVISLNGSNDVGKVRIINEPSDPCKILEMAYKMNDSGAQYCTKVENVLKTYRPRELEQLSYSFLISDISLSGITHIVRHRIQSIIIPPIQSINHSRYILPDAIKNNKNAYHLYIYVLEKSNSMVKKMSQNINLQKYSYYYALSGNTMDIMTTINVRELNHFIRLRACNRAQWEIRNIVVEMLRQLRNRCPQIFNGLGTSCYMDGICPEGNLTCGKMKQVMEQFKSLN